MTTNPTNRGAFAPRRSLRYGKLVRGWNWRTTQERLDRAEKRAKSEGISKTELLEKAIDKYLSE